MKRRGRVLVVDDDAFSRTLYGEMLSEAGHETVTSVGGVAVLDLLRSEKFDAVVSDLVMPEITGLQVLETAQSLATPVEVIIVTGHATVKNAVHALRSGAFDYITKPVDREELLLAVQRLLAQRSLLDENRELKSYVGLFRRCQALASCFDREQILRMAVDALVEEMGAAAGVFLVPSGFNPKRAGSGAGEEDDPPPKGEPPVEERAQRGLRNRVHPALTGALGGDPLAFASVQILDAKAGASVSGAARLSTQLGPGLVVPVRAGSAVFGAMFVGRPGAGEPFGLAEIGKADFFGKQVGLALDNASRFEEAKELAYVDDLTELYNVRYLNFILDKEIRRARRYTTPLAVLFMDLDEFKGVNDRHGHLTGSRMLIEVAAVIQRCVRDTDVLVRYGGDEYTVLLPNTDGAGAVVVAERIRASIEQGQFRTEEGEPLRITASIGVAAYPEHAKDKRDILRMADAAMYYGKANGRNVVYLAGDLLDPVVAANAAAARIAHAEENRERRAASASAAVTPAAGVAAVTAAKKG